jgi:hypothetical protein
MPGKYTLSQAKKKLASQGRFGDTEIGMVDGKLEHLNKLEKYLLDNKTTNQSDKYLLKKLGASRTTNPKTGLTENWGWSPPTISIPVPKINVPKSTGDIVKGVQKSYDTSVKAHLPEGASLTNVGTKFHEALQAGEHHIGGFITGMGRSVVGGAMQILTGKNPYDNQGSSDTDTSGSSVTGGQSYKGFGAVKRRKKKKKVIGGQGEGTETSIATAGKRDTIITPGRNKRSGLSIPSRGSGLSGTSPSYGLG